MNTKPITQDEVTEALKNLHPNKDDWTSFERSNMERALYRFWIARIAGTLVARKK